VARDALQLIDWPGTEIEEKYEKKREQRSTLLGDRKREMRGEGCCSEKRGEGFLVLFSFWISHSTTLKLIVNSGKKVQWLILGQIVLKTDVTKSGPEPLNRHV